MISLTLLHGHILEALAALPAESVHCVVTSPPYWGLRDYGLEPVIWGGAADCQHEWGEKFEAAGTRSCDSKPGEKSKSNKGSINRDNRQKSQFCRLCGAWRASYGLEPLHDCLGWATDQPCGQCYICHSVQIFREVRRVLRKDGTLWLNIGDSMFGGGGAHKSHHANPGISKSAQRGGVPREAIYGKNGKQPGYYQDDDCLLKNPYGAGQEIDLISRKSHTCTRPVLGLTSGVVCPSLENKGLNCFFLESLGLTPLILFEQSNLSMPYQQQVFCPFGGLLLVVHQSTIAEFWQRLPALCLQMDNSFSCPLMLCSSLPDAPVFVHNSLAEPPYIKPYHINKLKAKDLCMIPFRLALALQADGWWLRSDIIWAKPNPMPEPCTDRPTRSHEYIFLLTKSAKYFWDQAAVRENNSQGAIKRFGKNPSISVNNRKYEGIQSLAALGSKTPVWFSNGRNLRSVWTITTQPFPGAHFATFPTKIVEICIKAGTSEKGCCPQCGAPWERVIEKTGGSIGKDWNTHNRGEADLKIGATKNIKNTDSTYRVETLGWRPTCSCQAGEPTSCTILDPFSGSGTTLLVAAKMGCQAIGCELSADYVEMSRQRLQAELGMLAEIEVVHLT